MITYVTCCTHLLLTVRYDTCDTELRLLLSSEDHCR